jgi:tetratricopeptide (TPR) repeat protein
MPNRSDKPGPSPHQRTIIIAVVLLGAVLLAFSPALDAGFVSWDDPEVASANPHIRGLTSANLHWMFTQPLMGHYHPLTWVSYAVDYELWGLKPSGWHLTNILLHGISAVLVYLLAKSLFATKAIANSHLHTSSPPHVLSQEAGAILAAALFALHPLRVESVAWVTERRDVLSGVFLVGAMLAYVKKLGSGNAASEKQWGSYLLCLLLLALSLLSKAWGMSFFVLALILDWDLGRLSLNPLRWFKQWRILAEKLPMAAMGVAAAVMAGYAQKAGIAAKSLQEWGIEQRAVQANYGLAFYFWKTIWPSSLATLYQLPSKLHWSEPRYLAAYATVAALLVVVVILGRRWRAVPAAFAAYLILLLPVLGIAQSGDQFVADRYSYIACIPLALLAGGTANQLLPRLTTNSARTGLRAALAGWVLALAAATWVQSDTWHDTETLWRHAAAVAPSSMVDGYLAEELEKQGRKQEAADWYARAVGLDPENGRAWYSYGNLLVEAGRYEEAEQALKMAAAKLPQKYIAQMNLGTLYLHRLHRPKDAEAAYRAAVQDVENNRRLGSQALESSLPYLGMGDLMARTGRKEEAREWFEKARQDEKTRAMAEQELRRLDQE